MTPENEKSGAKGIFTYFIWKKKWAWREARIHALGTVIMGMIKD